MICSSLRLKLALQVVPLALPGGLFSLTFFLLAPYTLPMVVVWGAFFLPAPYTLPMVVVWGAFFLPFFWPFRH